MLDALKFFLFVILLLVTIMLNQHVTSKRSAELDLDLLWQIQDSKPDYVIPNQTLPSGVYTALEQSMVIGSLLEDYNDVNTSWVGRTDWIYRTNLSCLAKDYNYVLLTFHGVDTFATIHLGDRKLGTTDNMFVRYRYDIRDLCDGSTHELRVEFRSPVVEASERAKSRDAALPPIVPECPPGVYNGHCHMNLIRKMQASFAWDWGLAAPSMGIWKQVRLEYYSSALIRDLTVVISEAEDNLWAIVVGVYLETGLASQKIDGVLTFKIIGVPLANDNEQSLSVMKTTDAQGELYIEQRLTVRRNAVERWWPNGYGKQVLYSLYVKWADAAVNSVKLPHPDTYISEKVIRIGFRTVQVNQERATDGGLMFYFKVNDVPIFAKGSNWIPSSVLPERSYDANYVKFLLYAARDAHMNMLRVWGGGLYESDHFYRLADELGLLLWHDLMFACSMYPTEPDFLRTVRTEVRQNVRRIQYHPSVAVWATNNENEVALRQNWYKTQANYSVYYEQYVELYVRTVLPEVEAIDRWRTVLVSSPSNGDQSLKEDYIAQNPQDPLYGDVHYYNYFLDGWDAALYRGGRFVSEYGYQSFPAFTSWPEARSYSATELGELIRHRQHSPLGNEPILKMIEYNLPVPSDPAATSYWPTLIYLSQLSQAMIVKAETEVYRAHRNDYHTMGALYWQLNDVWIAPSWSSIEYGGTFKLLHVWLRAIFAPEHLVAFVNARRELEVWAIRDTLDPSADELWDVELRLHRYGSFQPVDKIKHQAIRVPPNSVAIVVKWDVYGYLAKKGLRPADHLLLLVASRSATPDGQPQQLAENFVLLDKLKNVRSAMTAPTLVTVSVVSAVCSDRNNLTSVSLEVSVRAPALFVYLQLTPENSTLKQCQFSANGFLQFQPLRTVQLTCVDPGCRSKILARDITVQTVNELLAH
ncbi:beta-mannosidase [Anopheles ziemanni]|uniref:beta-mannosidase n=1 Tax=Anopheles coustani TaxID=139045 RepID=UPI002659243D|nr:beta-mannosidase [Anopheles coustani]XP_058176341.1 beta-mannosidase [Anopheles ziemanni]